MANQTTVLDRVVDVAIPEVRRIGVADLRQVLRQGAADFAEKPSHLIMLALIYPILAFVLIRLVFGYDVLPLLFPLAAGFALIGPLAAIGLYEFSRRREHGLEVAWHHAFEVFKSAQIGAILALGAVLVAIFVLWEAVALALYGATLGAPPTGLGEFAGRLFGTPEGWALILLGNGIGFLFALVVLAIATISFPMLIDRPVSALTAVRTSVRAFLANPVTMCVWGLIVSISLVLGSLPAFIGLAVVMPILGHATWHLYRRVVEP